MIFRQKSNLVLAIQKSGRLSESSLDLLKDCGIKLDKAKERLLSSSNNFPLEVLFLRDDDIPACLANGEADVAIVGENIIQERNYKLETKIKLGFGQCRLSIAVPKGFYFESIKSLEGKCIATSYPNILKSFLKSNNVEAEIRMLSGSVEIATSIEIADAICDLVSSGGTLIAHGLVEVQRVMDSQAVLVANPSIDLCKIDILEKLIARINAVLFGRDHKYILFNAPNESLNKICELLPSISSPTVMPLAKSGWSAFHSVVREEDFWDMVDKLKQLGAEGILVTAIEKAIP